ncbi:Pentatricopeptide repeat-containing protein [Rhynchospora pubera]|uniref:Pentatricopeptide repeat-containing protein n=1 Tax=Rhynchospora pubera TaxID=906938 RepID=A0AAV8D3M4_9POAL|nr:Pentatricopeptide repeat-containing protein [Rhynchospora pubera]
MLSFAPLPLRLSSPFFPSPYPRAGKTQQALRAEGSVPAPPPPLPKKNSRSRSRSTTKRKSNSQSGDASAMAEAAVVVRQLLRRTQGGKETIVSLLNKNVRVIRQDHCFLLFEDLAKRDGWLQCLEIFRWMQRQRWYIADNGVFSKLISVMGKKGQVRMAMWLFSQMRNSGCRPDTSVYNSLITAHLHSRDKTKALAKALGYFEKMKAIERCRPNIVTYNILLRAFAQASHVQQVETLFKDMEDSVITPDVYTYNGVMDAYGKNGMLREMEAVLVRMKSYGCKPDVITFNTLIDSYGRKQAFDKMEQVFKSLLRSKEPPTLPTFHCMITNYGKARLREKAELVVKKMDDLGYRPTYVTRECLIMMYGYCGCVSKAREVFDKMLAKGHMQVSSLNAMLDAYCMNGVPSEAYGLLEYVIRRGTVVPNSSTYKLLYKAFTKAARKDLVDVLLKKMDQQGIVPNKRFFLDALEAYGSSSASASDSSESVPKSSSTKDSSKKPRGSAKIGGLNWGWG